MTIAFDSISAANASTVSCVPSGTPRGVIAFLQDTNQATDRITTAATYDGVAMAEPSPSGYDANSGTVGGWHHTFFLGATVSSGTVNFIATTLSTGSFRAYVVLVTAAADVEVLDTSASGPTNNQNFTDTLANGAVTGFCAASQLSGSNALTEITQLSGWTERGNRDYGPRVGLVATLDTNASGNVTFGFDSNFTRQNSAFGISINEIAAAGGAPLLTLLGVG